MSINSTPTRVHKRLLQFNNLPIAFGEIDETTYTAAFKGETQPYTNHQHGGYYAHLGEYGVLQTSQFDASLYFDFKKVACADKPRYARFIKRQLARSGRLWAVQNGGDVIWANARVLSIHDANAVQEIDCLKLDVTFELIDGYWVLAWKTRTFMAPYCPDRFTNFDEQYCWQYDDAKCDITGKDRCLPCYRIEPEPNNDGEYKPLCSWSRKELTEIFGARCPSQMHIRYDCDLEQEWFCYDVSWGDKYKLKNTNQAKQNITEIEYCTLTDLPTDMVQVRLVGAFKDPVIEINGDRMEIKGDFPEGSMIVAGFGMGVSFWKAKKETNVYVNNKDFEFLGSGLQNTTVTNVPYFELNPGKNIVKVTGNVRDKKSFVYVKCVEITF